MPPFTKKLWSGPDNPTGPRVNLVKGRVYSNPGRCTAPLLAQWMRAKAAAGGHSLSVRRPLPGLKSAYHAYCRLCGMPGKGWTLARKDSVGLDGARTVMVNGQPMVEGPTAAAGTRKLTFSASGPVFRVLCPKSKLLKPKPAAAPKPPPHLLALVEVTIDLRTGAAWVGPKQKINPFYEASYTFQPAAPSGDRPPMNKLMRDAGPLDNLIIIVKPALSDNILKGKQETGANKITNVIFGNVGSKGVITETIEM